MKIYVASSWRNDRHPLVVKALRQAGHEVYDFRRPDLTYLKLITGHEVYDFRRPDLTYLKLINGVLDGGFHWSDIDPDWQKWQPETFRESLSHPLAEAGFLSDSEGMKWADAFVLVMPCGLSAHLELGWACGAGKKTIILLSESEPELMYKLADHICVDMVEVLSALRSYRS